MEDTPEAGPSAPIQHSNTNSPASTAAGIARAWAEHAKPRLTDHAWEVGFTLAWIMLTYAGGWLQYTPGVVTATCGILGLLAGLLVIRIIRSRWGVANWAILAACILMLPAIIAAMLLAPPVATRQINKANADLKAATRERTLAITNAGTLEQERDRLKQEFERNSAELKEANSQLENRVQMRELRNQLTPFLMRAYDLRLSIKLDSSPPVDEFLAFRSDLLLFANEHLEQNQIDRLGRPRAGENQLLVAIKDPKSKSITAELYAYEQLIRDIISELR